MVLTLIAHALGANVENLTLHEFGPINGSGNSLNNVMVTNSYNNSLFGSGDTLTGAEGDDTLSDGNGYDSVDGGIGSDLIDGGNASATLIGGTGLDTLTGRAKSDAFQGNASTDGADTITDFVTGMDRFATDNTGFGIVVTGTLRRTASPSCPAPWRAPPDLP
jgi:Ca2+-binding RTX toxin-like protein